MEPKIIVHITPEGVGPIEIQAHTEREQAIASEILEKIQPCLDVADAILKKTSLGVLG